MSISELTSSDIQVSSLAGGKVALSAADVDRLRNTVGGRVLRPGDAGWETAVLLWNADAATRPALVVQPTTSQGAAAAVLFAREHRLRGPAARCC